MVGTRSASTSSSVSALSTRVTRPTKPSSESSRSARSIPPSIPVRPTAGTPRPRSAATTRPLARPPRTASATSRVLASLTRRPRTKRVSIPRRSAHSPTSGPPPCTTTSGWPASFSATTASSAASSSAPTDPPIFNTRRSLRGVVGIYPHVLGGEIGPPRVRLSAPEPELDLDPDLRLADDRADPRGIERSRRARIEHHDLADPHGGSRGIDPRARASRRREDAAPVRIGAMDRGLHEIRCRYRPRGPLRILVGDGPSHHHFEDARHPFAIGDDLSGERFAERTHRPLERTEVFAAGFDPRCAVREHEQGVVRARVT